MTHNVKYLNAKPHQSASF